MEKTNAEERSPKVTHPLDVLDLYESHSEKIFRYALNRTGDVEVARDITADVFLKAHKARWKFIFTGAPVSAWLYRIAGNEILSFQRKLKYKPVALEQEIERNNIVPFSLRGDLQEEILTAQKIVDQNKVFLRVQKQLRKLPNKYQEVIVLRYLEEKSILEIATLLGKKEGTVKSLLSRGIARLKRRTATERDIFTQNGLLVETSVNEGVNLS